MPRDDKIAARLQDALQYHPFFVTDHLDAGFLWQSEQNAGLLPFDDALPAARPYLPGIVCRSAKMVLLHDS